MSNIECIINPEPEKITFKYKGFYDAIIDVLSEGSRVFIKNMTRRQAYYAKQIILKRLELDKSELVVLPALYEGNQGYLLYLNKR